MNSRWPADEVRSREYPMPPPLPPPRTGGHITLGLSAVAVVMFASLFFSGISVIVTVLATAGFYGGIVVALALIDSGYFNKREEEQTRREHIRLVYRTTVEPVTELLPPGLPTNLLQPPYEPPAGPHAISGGSYVPAVPTAQEIVKADATNFVKQLFDSATGLALPYKITPAKGQIQHKKPTLEALDYLVSLGIVSAPTGKQLYWGPRYSTLQEALDAIRLGRRVSYKDGEEGGEEGPLTKKLRKVRPAISASKRFRILQRDNFQCQLCGFKVSRDNENQLRVDHKLARTQGGSNDDDNLWTLCDLCNSGKGFQIVEGISEE